MDGRRRCAEPAVRVTLLGTGCPALHPRRAGAGLLVEAGGTRVLVDCGHGVAQRLAEGGVRIADLDAVLASHLHSDHLADLWTLVVGGWHQGRSRPLRLLADPAVERLARGLEAAWAEERAQRLAFERRPNPAGFGLEVEPIEAGRRLALPGLEVEVVAVDHRPVEPAFGFVFRAGGRVLATSGDTRRSEALIAAARGCDLLIHEVFVHAAMPVVPGVRDAATIMAVASYHTALEEVGPIAAEAGASALLLTHIVPPEADPSALAAEAARGFAGPVIVGEDLLTVDLEHRRLAWRGLVAGLGRPTSDRGSGAPGP
jgi:ribonuclease Z